MKRTFEIDVKMLVRKTVIVSADTEAQARQMAYQAFVAGHWGNYVKYAQRGMAAPAPVEEILTGPSIDAVREITKPEIGR